MNYGYRSLCNFLTRNCNKTRKTGMIAQILSNAIPFITNSDLLH